jgi:hypothetical protein
MAGTDQSARLQGLLSGIADSVGGLGAGGDWTSNAIRNIARPEIDTADSRSVMSYADWARRNGYADEASKYLTLGATLQNTEQKKAYGDQVATGSVQMRALRGRIAEMDSKIEEVGDPADPMFSAPGLVVARDNLQGKLDTLISDINAAGESSRFGVADAGTKAYQAIVTEELATTKSALEMQTASEELIALRAERNKRLADGKRVNSDILRYLTKDQWDSYARSYAGARTNQDRIDVNERFGAINESNETNVLKGLDGGAKAGLAMIASRFSQMGEGKNLLPFGEGGTITLGDLFGDSFIGKFLGWDKNADPEARIFDSATNDFFESINSVPELAKANNEAIAARLMLNPDYAEADLPTKRQMETEAFINYYRETYPEFARAYASDKAELTERAKGLEVEAEDRAADWLPGYDPNGDGARKFNVWFESARATDPELTYAEAIDMWEEKYRSSVAEPPRPEPAGAPDMNKAGRQIRQPEPSEPTKTRFSNRAGR